LKLLIIGVTAELKERHYDASHLPLRAPSLNLDGPVVDEVVPSISYSVDSVISGVSNSIMISKDPEPWGELIGLVEPWDAAQLLNICFQLANRRDKHKTEDVIPKRGLRIPARAALRLAPAPAQRVFLTDCALKKLE